MSKRDSFDLTDPKQARVFLSRLWIGEMQITGVTLEKAGFKQFVDMTDEEVCIYASELHTEWIAPGRGLGSKIEYRKPSIQ